VRLQRTGEDAPAVDGDGHDPDVVEGVGGRDEVGDPFVRREQDAVAVGPLDHRVGEGTVGAVVPDAHDDAGAARGAEAGDVSVEALGGHGTSVGDPTGPGSLGRGTPTYD
jgi:hypothetical protein